MSIDIKKEDVILNVEGLSQLIWRLAFTEAIPEVVKMVEKQVPLEEFHVKLSENVAFLANAVYQVITNEELAVLFPEILVGINLGFLNGEKEFDKYIKKAKQKDFIKKLFESFVASMFLMSIETIFKMQQEAGASNDGKDIREELVCVEGGKSEESTLSE